MEAGAVDGTRLALRGVRRARGMVFEAPSAPFSLEHGAAPARGWRAQRCHDRGARAGDESVRSITTRQLEVLRELCARDGWARPMDLGARDGSLSRLVQQGFAERAKSQRWCGTRGSFYEYRATARGHCVLVALVEAFSNIARPPP